ncbi:MAG: CpaF family protein [Acidimicrobiia bacterium]|nr:CpaF family protein [Acidimicrobiia bacterium]NNF64636.1 CpaF family protein [Acidimicrobiia bacterium]
MGVIDRLVAALLRSGVPLEREALIHEGRRLLPEEAPLADRRVVERAVDRLVGLGPLEELLADPTVSDVLVNGPHEVWIERAGTMERTDVTFLDDTAVLAAVERMISPLGLRLDLVSPAVDARLPDGSRLHAIIPPAAVDGPIVAIRRFTQAVESLDQLVEMGGLGDSGASLLRDSVAERRNILVSGGTGSGKTTMLNLLSMEIAAGQRIVSVEDAAELHLSGHVVRLEARPPNPEGAGEISVRTLLRHALRLRPDRLIVGEVRGAEALDMIQALSTGHAGSMSTIHANGPHDALLRLHTLALVGGGVDAETVKAQIARSIEVVVHMARIEGMRRVESIAMVDDSATAEVYRWHP